MNINRLTRFTVFTFLLFATVSFSQNNTPGGNNQQILTPEDPQYQILKENGTLNPANVSYIIPQGQIIQGPVDIPSANAPLKTLTQCTPLIPIDNTFQPVQFTSSSSGPPLYRNDDGSSPTPIPLPFTFTFYGVNYTQLWINNNGNVSFNGPYGGYSASGFPFSGNVMIAPFWGDVDTRNTASGVVYCRVSPTNIVIRWNNVGYFNSMADKKNDFQLILTNGSDPILPIGTNAQMAYGDMQWTTGSASSGTGGFGGTPANVGANLGNGVNFIQFGRFNTNTSNYDGPFGANDGINWLDNKAFYFDLSDPANNNNVAPIANGISACDTVDMCEGDTLNFAPFSFLSPEQGQTTTITINSAAIPGFTGNFVSGNTATGTARFIPTASSVGYTTLLFNGTDNGTPSATTTIEFVVHVFPKPHKPIVTGDSILCPGETTTLNTQAGYSNYFWSPGAGTTNSQAGNSAGVYTVSYDSAGCSSTSNPFTVTQVPNPIPSFAPPVSTCSSPTALVIASPGYVGYSWLPSPLNNDTVYLLPGAYTLTVTDNNNCSGSIPVNINPISSITASLLNSTQASCPQICNGTAQIDVQNGLGAITYTWNPSISTNDIGQNLCVGNYDVVVVDTAGCRDTVSFNINFNYNLTTQETHADPLCNGSFDGQIAITPQNGVSPYTYNWSPVTVYSSSSNTLSAGIYYITTTDAAGCATADTISLINPPILRALASSTNETCPGFCDGTASVNISGGTPNYTIMWTPGGQQTAALTNLCGGTNIYSVTDANGCNLTGVVEINTIPKPIAAFSNSSATANGLDPTVVFVNESSADVTTWYWDFEDVGPSAQEDPTIVFPGMGTYNATLIVTNGYGCKDTTSASVKIKDINVLYIPNSFSPNNDGLNDRFMPKGVIDNSLDYVMYVFNRWGERLFITHSLFEGWDGTFGNGKDCPSDLYLYKIVITNTKAETQEIYNGQITLLR